MKNNSHFPKRLKSLREERGLGQQQLADQLRVKVGSIGNWETSGKLPKVENLGKLAAFFGTTIGYLKGEDDGLAPDGKALRLTDEGKSLYRAVEKLATAAMAPLISWASAGTGKEFEDQGADVEKFPTRCKDPHCYCLEVEGDSMEKKFSQGDILFVAPSQEARNGDLVAAKTRSGDIYFKIYHWSQHVEDPVKLTSINSEVYPLMEVPREEFLFIKPVHSVLRLLRKDL